MYSNGMYSNGLYSNGLYSNGMYSTSPPNMLQTTMRPSPGMGHIMRWGFHAWSVDSANRIAGTIVVLRNSSAKISVCNRRDHAFSLR